MSSITSTPSPQGQPDQGRGRLASWLGAFLVVVALVSALGTFLVLSGSTPIAPVHRVVVTLFVFNLVVILALLFVVSWQAFSLFRARRRGAAAAGLHVRIVLLFSLVAAAPAILVAVVATITLERGLEPWFSDRMRAVIFRSVEVADAYTTSQCTILARDARLLADDILRIRPMLDSDRNWVEGWLTTRATAMGLPVVMVVRRPFDVVVRARLNVIASPSAPPAEAFDDTVSSGDPICSGGPQRVFSVLMRLQEQPELFLLIARQVDELAVDFPTQARQGAVEYLAIDARRQGVQIAFASMFLLIALTVLLSAIWLGLRFADSLVAPIRRMIHATDQVASGNFYVQVPVRKAEGDLAHLGQTFNKMTSDLRRQRDGLMNANDLADKRRRFTETVLGGVSAGVIGLDQDDHVTLLNRSAEQLLGLDRRAVNQPLAHVAPELVPVIREARSTRQRSHGGPITLLRAGRERTMNVRVTREGEGAQQGLVVTLDDITDLVTAQRTSAWADVARRIAHEIKNPLTPIQLSAERIRRKFGRTIVTDREVLEQCTDTIVRQVEDIRRMVDEFSSFARMPKPQPVNDDLSAIIREVCFLMRVGYPDLTIEATGADAPAYAVFDRRLISQALTNIIKNATEAIEAAKAETGAARIDVMLARGEGGWIIDVQDNGKGFPAENRQRLLEPYMTTREGGTGLGLAIVGKIFEDHGGRIELLDRADGERGANVRMFLPATDELPARPAAETVTDA